MIFEGVVYSQYTHRSVYEFAWADFNDPYRSSALFLALVHYPFNI